MQAIETVCHTHATAYDQAPNQTPRAGVWTPRYIAMVHTALWTGTLDLIMPGVSALKLGYEVACAYSQLTPA